MYIYCKHCLRLYTLNSAPYIPKAEGRGRLCPVHRVPIYIPLMQDHYNYPSSISREKDLMLEELHTTKDSITYIDIKHIPADKILLVTELYNLD